MERLSSLTISILIVCSSMLRVAASTPKIKTYKTQYDFQKGEPKGVAISHRGELALAPEISEVVEAPISIIWQGVVDRQGSLYIAGGVTGQVHKVTPDGKSSLIFEATEAQIYCLAFDAGQNLYAGSSPGGKIYKLVKSGAEFKSSVFAELDVLYIWSLAFDKAGNLFVATGEQGTIYKVDKAGKSSVFYKCDDTHVVRLLMSSKGDLIAGTSGKAMLLRINSSGKAFVLHDSPLEEITAIYESGDRIFSAATSGSRLISGARRGAAVQSPGNDEEDADEGDEAEDIEIQVQAATATHGRPHGEIYRIEADGAVQVFQTLRAERIFCIASNGKGELLLGTGDNGRLYQMTLKGENTLLTEFDELQVTAFAQGKSALWVCTSNAGKLYRLGQKLGPKGTFMSDVYDADVVSHWGTLSWERAFGSGGEITMQTRSGNTEEPDKTWSEWSAASSADIGSPIKSPPARYLQIMATLETKGGKQPVLNEISFSHLQKNVAPVIKQIYVHPAGEYYPEAMGSGRNGQMADGAAVNENYQSQSMGRKSQRQGFRALSWSVEDLNGDRLSYDLYYHALGDKHWKELATDLTTIVYSWDSLLMPNGRYEAKLVAKDNLSNPAEMAMTAEQISEPFVVDNSGPEIVEIQFMQQSGKSTISFAARDEWTPIAELEYSINAEDWKLLYPVDGICDSRREEFRVVLNRELQSNSAIVIKVHDALGNVGFGTKKM